MIKKYLQALAKVLTIPIQHLKTIIIWLCSHNMVNAVNIQSNFSHDKVIIQPYYGYHIFIIYS